MHSMIFERMNDLVCVAEISFLVDSAKKNKYVVEALSLKTHIYFFRRFV